jgi:XTP/dITP diphosphohydrolase
MITVVVATHNAGKVSEIRDILKGFPLNFKNLGDFPGCPEVEESGATYLENAREKARTAASFSQEWSLADDSGLEVAALSGRPGVRSARFAGPRATDRDNIQKILQELSDRGLAGSPAAFRCVMVLRHPDGREFVSEGEWRGEIVLAPRGTKGFGYDPIFFLPEFGKTAAELTPDEKNRFSHRAQALRGIQKVLARL